MTTTDTAATSPSETGTAEPAAVPLSTPLPELHTPLSPQEITRRLDTAARRGRLPGYTTGGPNGALFEIRDFGIPFEGVLTGRLDGQTLRFSTAVQRRMPAVVVAILLVSIWPGVWFTESMLQSYFPNTLIAEWTYWWYLPLAILSAPWAMWSLLGKSRASIHTEAHVLVGKVAAELRSSSAAQPSEQAPQPIPR